MLRRRYGHARSKKPWQVALMVTSPERPGLRHQRQFTVSSEPKEGLGPVDRKEAIALAKYYAQRDGNTVVEVVSAVQGYR
jgi:hypothetical protein